MPGSKVAALFGGSRRREIHAAIAAQYVGGGGMLDLRSAHTRIQDGSPRNKTAGHRG